MSGHLKPIFDCIRNEIIVPDSVEESILLDGTQADCWYRKSSGYSIYYDYATDAKSRIWTPGNGGAAVIASGEFPCVVKVGSYYYMAYDDLSGDLHLKCSTDKVAWVDCNGGDPILTHTNVGHWANTIWNPAIAVVGSTWHLVQDGNDPDTALYCAGYSSAVATGEGAALAVSFDANLSALKVVDGFCGFLQYVPDRAALIYIHGTYTAGGIPYHISAHVGALADNLALAANWHQANFTLSGGTYYGPTDPTLCFNTDSALSWRMCLGFNWEQADGYRAYGQMGATEFYDAITAAGRSNAYAI